MSKSFYTYFVMHECTHISFFTFLCNKVCNEYNCEIEEKQDTHKVCIMNTIVKLKKNKMLGQFKNHVTIELTELSTETLAMTLLKVTFS